MQYAPRVLYFSAFHFECSVLPSPCMLVKFPVSMVTPINVLMFSCLYNNNIN